MCHAYNYKEGKRQREKTQNDDQYAAKTLRQGEDFHWKLCESLKELFIAEIGVPTYSCKF